MKIINEYNFRKMRISLKITFAVHLVIFIRFGEVQSSIALSADEKVREVDFLKFQPDWWSV